MNGEDIICANCHQPSPSVARYCMHCGTWLAGDTPRRRPANQRVVITGIGAVTPLGLTAEETWKNLLAGRSGIDLLTQFDTADCTCKIGGEVRDFRPQEFMDTKEAKRMARFSQFAVAATKMALDDAGLAPDPAEAAEMGVLIATGAGGTIVETERGTRTILEKGAMRVSPNHLLIMLPNMASFHVAEHFGFRGYNNTVVTACAAGSQAIGEAAEVIRRGSAQVIVTGGSEATLGLLGLASFSLMRGLSTRNDEPARACRPFDRDRDGFILSEGAAIFILESLEHAQARGARIYAEVLGYAANSDGYHPIAPEPQGSGAGKVIQQALRDAGIEPGQVDYINAHGTGTPLGDVAETLAIKMAFGQDAYRVPISATKSMIGHALGAAGAVEVLPCVLSIRDGIIHPTINYENPDPDCDLDYVPNVARPAKVDIVLKNSFGMGSQNVCLVLARYRERS
jgi:3-oxoacyl-[acyl-carrier-protein] synthase II